MVHHDYNSVKGFLQISVYSDRTEISNYGGLPKGITISDLKTEHHSILRNPDIAQLCFIRGYIEMLGSGTLRMTIVSCNPRPAAQNPASFSKTFTAMDHGPWLECDLKLSNGFVSLNVDIPLGHD